MVRKYRDVVLKLCVGILISATMACGSVSENGADAFGSLENDEGSVDSPAQLPEAVDETLKSASSPAKGKARAEYYISMGDSLAVGAQQNPRTGVTGETRNGYADQLFRAMKLLNPSLQHIRIGCGGEMASTMIAGGVCEYPNGSQLAEAVKFIQDHPGSVKFLTINIGANDIAFSGCLELSDPAEQGACFQTTFQKLGGDLAHIFQSLAQASQGRFPIAAANLPNSYLNSWLAGPQGQAMAMATYQLQTVVNGQVIEPVIAAFGVRLVDMAKVFHSDDFETMVETDMAPPNDVLPLNVATVCEWTYACPDPASGLAIDYHFTTKGYFVMAKEYFKALLPLRK